MLSSDMADFVREGWIVRIAAHSPPGHVLVNVYHKTYPGESTAYAIADNMAEAFFKAKRRGLSNVKAENKKKNPQPRQLADKDQRQKKET